MSENENSSENNAILDAMQQKYWDQQMLKSMTWKMNDWIKDRLTRRVFLQKYLLHQNFSQVMASNNISKRKYYELITAAEKTMIDAWGLHFYDENGRDEVFEEACKKLGIKVDD